MRSQPNFHEEKTAFDELTYPESSFYEPIDRAATSSSNYTVIDHKNNVRRSLLIDDDIRSQQDESQLSRSQQNSIKRKISIKKNKQRYFEILGNIATFIKTRTAIKPSVTDDPRLFSPNKKRLILACLACGSSLNGFCSTVYVSTSA
jgi:hypothetical protein